MEQKKQIAFHFGRWGEDAACLYFRLKGYRIVKRNHRSPFGEIDIIAKRRQTLVFIEVKSRARLDDALNSLSFYQQKRITNAAKSFLSANPRYCGCETRFDFLAISAKNWPKHIENAWLDET
ncbi:YraN family protein [Terasakiella sp. A23]|uniref:YraN family protein n=1 Tax=Terasakiella sp. FCG-A23 TaxID=3080561 RepID=UPI00295485C4|nr:YraN family protein [Terasakiella sp. A23]MDV7339905.1 YraN family protein [Terasakiella sp. A23]